MSDFEMAWSNLDKPCKLYKDKVGDHGSGRPTEKPLGLIKWCIDFIPEQATVILDPFMGSGTTGVAAVENGKQFVGVEVIPKYFDIACKRIEKALTTPQFFVQKPKLKKQKSKGFL